MSKIPNPEAQEQFLRFAHQLADVSAEQIKHLFRRISDVENKEGEGRFDPVTQADRRAERVIRDQIMQSYPSHGIVGEEFGTHQETADFCWVIDPIDGTRAFLLGYPLWGTLICLMFEGRPLIGLMNQPFTGERFWGQEKTALYRGPDGEKPLNTRSTLALDEAFLATTSPDLFASGFELEAFDRLKERTRMTRYGGDCYSYCMLAAGHVDLVVEAGLKSYDIAPLIPIIEGAGGVVTCWRGEPADKGGRIVAAATPDLHTQALAVLSEGRPETD